MQILISKQDTSTSRSATLLALVAELFPLVKVYEKPALSDIIDICINLKNVGSQATVVFAHNSRNYILIAIIFKIFGSRIIYDFGYPVTDSLKVSRRYKFLSSIVDYLFCCLSDIVLFETYIQKKLSRFAEKGKVLYAMPVRKVVVSQNPFASENWTRRKYLLFRGKINPEAGIESIVANIDYLLELSKCDTLVVQTPDYFDVKILEGIEKSRLILINRYLTHDELHHLVDNCSAMLGQMGFGTSRLNVTIPHKAFEALSYNKPLYALQSDGMNEFAHIQGAKIIQLSLKSNGDLERVSNKPKGRFQNIVDVNRKIFQ